MGKTIPYIVSLLVSVPSSFASNWWVRTFFPLRCLFCGLSYHCPADTCWVFWLLSVPHRVGGWFQTFTGILAGWVIDEIAVQIWWQFNTVHDNWTKWPLLQLILAFLPVKWPPNLSNLEEVLWLLHKLSWKKISTIHPEKVEWTLVIRKGQRAWFKI